MKFLSPIKKHKYSSFIKVPEEKGKNYKTLKSNWSLSNLLKKFVRGLDYEQKFIVLATATKFNFTFFRGPNSCDFQTKLLFLIEIWGGWAWKKQADKYLHDLKVLIKPKNEFENNKANAPHSQWFNEFSWFLLKQLLTISVKPTVFHGSFRQCTKLYAKVSASQIRL